MSESIQSPLPTLTELSSALQNLQSTLDPLLSRPLAETLANLEASLPPQTQNGSGPSGSNDASRRLDSAKLRTSIAYVLLDLVWIHLRLKGVDPHTHPVAGELKRVQGYFVKIRNVEKAGPNSGSGAVEGGEAGKQRMRLDRGAAKRMVKGAIAEGGEKGRHTKFGGDGQDQEGGSSSKAGKAKEKGQRRATKDPFDGYGDEEQQKGKAAAGKEDASASSSKTTAKKRHSDEAMGGEASGSATTSVDSSGGGSGASKHQKKKQKKQRRG